MHKDVTFALEDHLGFIWFASQVGLYRFDGHELKMFGHDAHDTSSLSSWGVHDITEDKKGRIWVSTVYGINLLDRRTGTFERLLPDPEKVSTKGGNFIHTVYADQTNQVWAISNQDVFVFNERTHTLQVVTCASNPTSTRFARSITSTDDGTIWCGAKDGLLKLAPGDTSFTYILPRLEKGDEEIEIYKIARGHNGMLWLSTDHGLAQFDPRTLKLTVNFLPGEAALFHINAIIQADNGDLWMAFENEGVGRLHTNGSFQHFKHDEEDFHSIANNEVRSIMEDQFGNIWLCTTIGVSKITANRSGFALIQNAPGMDKLANQVRRVHRDRHGNLWTQTAIGIYVKASGEKYGVPVHVLPEGATYTTGNWIFEDTAGHIWIPVDNHGLWKASAGSHNFKQVKGDSRLEKAHVEKMVQDNKNPDLIWLGTTAGLCAFNTRTLNCTWHFPLNQLPDISTNRVVIFEQFGDALWLYYTYNNSLGRFDKSTGAFELFRPPAPQQYVLEGVIRDMAITPDSNIWLTTSSGLTRYHISTNTFVMYPKAPGLLANSFYAVVLDQRHQIWVSGDQFISRFDQTTETFKNYMPVTEVKAFWGKAKFMAGDGQIYFGCLNGIYTFHPDSIQTDLISPAMVLTNFIVKGAVHLLDTAFEYVSEILLQHDQNDITFDFTGIHLVDPEANQYRCKLEGLDESWRMLGSNHAVNYTNLNHGSYTFLAQAANRDGVWSTKGLSIALQISPPFTQTGWFRAMLGLILILFLYLVFRIFTYQQSLRRQKKMAEVTAEFRLAFLSHVSHEIRTPMNAIIGLSELAAATELTPQQHNYLAAIKQSSRNLLKIINQLLDHSKIESGMFSFSKSRFDILTVAQQLKAALDPLARQKDLQLEVSIAQDVPQQLIGDELRLTQILTNLIGNAIKFTEVGQVNLSITASAELKNGKMILFDVKDTGVGIAHDKLDHVFDRFFDDQKGMSDMGSGLGLFITRQLIEQQGGSIHIESRVNTGTHIRVKMPFDVPETDVKTPDHVQNVWELPSNYELSILLVDDAPFNLLVLTDMINQHLPKTKISSAETGKEALDMAAVSSFDLIIMDVKMPGMDGHETTRLIRQMNGSIKSVPILGATAGAMPSQVQACLDSGMNDVITKPIEFGVLMEKIFQLTKIRKE